MCPPQHLLLSTLNSSMLLRVSIVHFFLQPSSILLYIFIWSRGWHFFSLKDQIVNTSRVMGLDSPFLPCGLKTPDSKLGQGQDSLNLFPFSQVLLICAASCPIFENHSVTLYFQLFSGSTAQSSACACYSVLAGSGKFFYTFLMHLIFFSILVPLYLKLLCPYM